MEIILFDCNQHFSAQRELKLCMWVLIVTLSYLVIIQPFLTRYYI